MLYGIKIEPGVSQKTMIDFDNLCCFQGRPDYLFNSYREWFAVLVMCMCFLIPCLFVSYGKILAM